MNEITYRPCRVLDSEGGTVFNGLFHGFVTRSDVVPPSPLRGGHSGGVVAEAFAIVELANGVCEFIPADRIGFTDGLAKRVLSNDKPEQEVSE